MMRMSQTLRISRNDRVLAAQMLQACKPVVSVDASRKQT
jgi:hypothetical protein